ncbi:hypothetical protein AR691_13715 [Bacillus amyloliquefaciens]|nr:hypothetical protein AR691_13715 [Bacillus amyloliquefaciens]
MGCEFCNLFICFWLDFLYENRGWIRVGLDVGFLIDDSDKRIEDLKSNMAEVRGSLERLDQCTKRFYFSTKIISDFLAVIDVFDRNTKQLRVRVYVKNTNIQGSGELKWAKVSKDSNMWAVSVHSGSWEKAKKEIMNFVKEELFQVRVV